MPRAKASFDLTYFDDPDVIALSPDADRVYMRLVISPTLTQAGTGPWMPRQVLRTLQEFDEARLLDAIAELEDARFAFVDHDTDELFVRPLMRRDGVAAMPNVLIGACRSGMLTRSARLRKILAEELARIYHDGYRILGPSANAARRNASSVLRRSVTKLDPDAEGFLLEPIDNPSTTADDGKTRTPSEESRNTSPRNPSSNPSTAEPNRTLPRTPGGGGGGGGKYLTVGGSGRELPSENSSTDVEDGSAAAPAGNLDPANPRCPEHAHLGADDRLVPCMACKRVRVWVESAPERATAAKRAEAAARRKALADCTHCDEYGWRIDSDGGQIEPVIRCDHTPLPAALAASAHEGPRHG